MSNVQRLTPAYGTESLAASDLGPDDSGQAPSFGLTVTNLRKSFKSPAGETIEIIRGVSFSASAGEIVAIMGASGAGKSTMLNLLGGLEAVDDGKIILGNSDITGTPALGLPTLRNQYIGFVFQFHYLLLDLSAAENVALPLMIARANKATSMRRAGEVLEQIGLRERVFYPARHLSGGEQQRVAVARALITKPALVLADEPTGNLDHAAGADVAALLVSYCRERRAVVVVATHNERLADICDRVLLLKQGAICES